MGVTPSLKIMRLLSFYKQVEATLEMLRPEASGPWKRRVNYDIGEAISWHDGLGLALALRTSAVGEGRHSLVAKWLGPTGETLFERAYFCGQSSFDWQTAAESVAEAMPESSLSSSPNLSGDLTPLRAANA